MANITTSGSTGYPGVLDTRTVLTDGSSGDQIVCNHPNGLGAAVLALETELGIDPAGTATDLRTRLMAAHDGLGTIVLGSSTAVVGILPVNFGGLGQTVASATKGGGQIIIFGNGVPQVASLTAGNNVTVTPGSGTLTIAVSTPSGTYTAGATLTAGPPLTNTTKFTQAHGLGATPSKVEAWLECTTPNLNYVTGMRVDKAQFASTGGTQGISIVTDGINTYILTATNTPLVLDFNTPGNPSAITLGSWKIVAVPYKLN